MLHATPVTLRTMSLVPLLPPQQPHLVEAQQSCVIPHELALSRMGTAIGERTPVRGDIQRSPLEVLGARAELRRRQADGACRVPSHGHNARLEFA